MNAVPVLRVARPSDDIEALLRFYGDGLGFEILYRFDDHDGFDGIMLGHPGFPYHFEFTRHRIESGGHPVGKAPTPDNLLVFYLPEEGDYKAAIARMEATGAKPVRSYNPYWDAYGRTYEDPDGYRVVLANQAWQR
jgi:catechol 2,3-dioxygenase-like lactoylglutathione lyase family enzyme